MAEPAVIKEVRRLLLLNFVSYVLLAVTGAALIGDAIDAGDGISDGPAESTNYIMLWTAASGFANLFATVAGLVGAAAALPGLHHVRAWSQGSLPAAAHAGFMAWLLTLLALGLAIKEVIIGASMHVYKLGSTQIFLGGWPYLLRYTKGFTPGFALGGAALVPVGYILHWNMMVDQASCTNGAVQT